MPRIIQPRPDFEIGPDGSPRYSRGTKWPAWALLALPFVLVMVPLYQVVRRRVGWAACLGTMMIFELLMMVVEHHSLIRGHWIYNEHRLLGPRWWGVPIEEPLLYYFLPPILVVMAYEFITGLLDGSVRWGRLADLPRRWRTVTAGREPVRTSRGVG